MTKRVSASRVKRANLSFVIMLFCVFAVIVLTEVLLLNKTYSVKQLAQDKLDAALEEEALKISILENLNNLKNLKYPSQFPYHIATVPSDARWQAVYNAIDPKFFVYSAYFERKLQKQTIRIIAAMRTKMHGSYFCQIHLENDRMEHVRARIKIIRENWNLRYSAAFILCPVDLIPANEVLVANVSVVEHTGQYPSNLLRIRDTHYIRNVGDKIENWGDDKIYVCVKPVHFEYDRYTWLLEWLEIQMLLGVSHFIIYVHTLHKTTECILKYYEHLGVVTLLPWHLNITSIKEIRNQGQFAAFNDCLYRSMSKAEWVMPIDFDEVIFPKKVARLQNILSALRQRQPPSSAFIFRNAFFYLNWPDDPQMQNNTFLTMRKTRRWRHPHSIKTRSKYIVKPQDAVELGNHFIWEMNTGMRTEAIPEEDGLLHHYRAKCEFGGSKCLQVSSTVDRTAHSWSRRLTENFKTMAARLHPLCDRYNNPGTNKTV